MRKLAILLAAFTGSCAHIPLYQAEKQEVIGTVKVWVQEDLDIAAADVINGCNYWAPMGVHCVLVSNPATADVRVKVSHESCLSLARKRVRDTQAGTMQPSVPLLPECKPDYPAQDKITEAWGLQAQSNLRGEIILFPSCMRWSSGHDMFSPAHATRIAAHEFGHELGVSHVPLACDDRCTAYEKDELGNKLCGPAIMNPPSAEVDGITPADAAAFKVRQPTRDPLRLK